MDTYGHTLADMLLPGGTNVAHTLVKEAGAGGIKSIRRVMKSTYLKAGMMGDPIRPPSIWFELRRKYHLLPWPQD